MVSAEVGRFTSIGPNCRYINATHAYKAPFATTCPLFFSKSKDKQSRNDKQNNRETTSKTIANNSSRER